MDLCLLAQAYAHKDGSQWLEARAVSLKAGQISPNAARILQQDNVSLWHDRPGSLDRSSGEWADLLVTLDPAARQLSSQYTEMIPVKYWHFPQLSGDGYQQISFIRDELRRRIKGMLGGLKMMGKNAGRVL